MGRRKVYIEEMNCFGEEVDYTLTCIDNDAFLRVWDVETLERILKTQLEHENYEMAELVKKHIELKRVAKLKMIEENKSILAMAELHMDERAVLVLKQRIFDLERQSYPCT